MANSVTCPAGCDDGYFFDLGTNRYNLCETCSGFGEVDPDAVCACGRPALMRKDSFAYCGRENCLKDLKIEATRSRQMPFEADWHHNF